jgi:hypothetical protein
MHKRDGREQVVFNLPPHHHTSSKKRQQQQQQQRQLQGISCMTGPPFSQTATCTVATSVVLCARLGDCPALGALGALRLCRQPVSAEESITNHLLR